MSTAARTEQGAYTPEWSAFDCSADGNDQLRNLIIELALTGRLVPQVSTDRPASGLVALARTALAGERTRTVEGLNPEPYALPPGWVWTQPQQLGWIAPRNQLDDSAVVGFVPMSAIPTDYRAPVTCEERRWQSVKKNYTHFADGDIAVAKIIPCFQNRKSCVLAGLPSGKGAGTTELHVLRPVPGAVDPEFMLLFFKSPMFVDGGEPRMTGTAGQKRVPVDYFAAAPLPLPPMEEQKRIVRRVTDLMAACDELAASQATAGEAAARFVDSSLRALAEAAGATEIDRAWARVFDSFALVLRRSRDVVALRDLVLELAARGWLSAPAKGDESVEDLVLALAKSGSGARPSRRSEPPAPAEALYPIPSRWRWQRLDQLADVVGGVTKGRDLRGRTVAAFPYLRVANVQRGFLDLSVMKEIEIATDELDRYRLAMGDVLFTEGGDWDKLGRSAVWRGEVDPCLHQNHVFRARLRMAGLEPEWFAMVANAPSGRRYFERASKQTTNLASINMTQLRACPMPVPPREEQRRTVRLVQAILEECDLLREALEVRDEVALKLAGTVASAASW